MERKPKKGARGHRPIFALLSRKKTLYSTRRLLEAARARGFRTKVVDVLRCNLVIERGRPRILIAAEELSG
ncbi:MAG: 30S ribosomal protein S6--L-glutamate ligase, partial [Deltaproteobacteria bacterium]